MTDEKIEWKDLKGYEGIYQISSSGLIRNRKSLILKTAKTNCGTATVILRNKDGDVCKSVGKLVLETFLGENPDMVVNYKDGDKTNNSLENLEWIKKVSGKSQKIKCIETNVVYMSISEAAKELDIPYYKVKQCCENSDISQKGMHFEYINKEVEKSSTIPNLPDEEWKYLEGSNNNYMISNMGRIKRLARETVLSNGTNTYFSEKLIALKLYDGKPKIHIRIFDENDKNKRILYDVEKQVLLHFTNYKKGPILHRNGDIMDCRLSNLIY